MNRIQRDSTIFERKNGRKWTFEAENRRKRIKLIEFAFGGK